MNPFNHFPKELAKVEKPGGEVVGPYKMIFTGDVIIVWDVSADIQEGDFILRMLPNGRAEQFTVTNSTFYQKISSIPAHYQIKFMKGAIGEKAKPQQTINIHSAQAVQIGDYNTQQITATIQTLVQKIDASDASQDEKAEAKSLLQNFLDHPLVAAVIGAAISLGS